MSSDPVVAKAIQILQPHGGEKWIEAFTQRIIRKFPHTSEQAPFEVRLQDALNRALKDTVPAFCKILNERPRVKEGCLERARAALEKVL